MLSAVMIDSSEPQWVKELKFDGAQTIVTSLEHGDILASTLDAELLCIERKTPNDLLGSIKDKRVFKQVAGMRSLSPWSYLVITGVIDHTSTGMTVVEGRTTGWNYDAVQGALLEIQDLGVKILTCRSDEDFEATVLRLAKRDRKSIKPIEPNKLPAILTPGEVLLTSLPGIGIEKAKQILAEFNNKPCDALSWLTWHRWDLVGESGTSIPGISTGTKRAIRSALCLDDNEVIEVVPDV